MNLRTKNLSVISQISQEAIYELRKHWLDPKFEDGFELDFIDDDEEDRCAKFGVDLSGIKGRDYKRDWAMFTTIPTSKHDIIFSILDNIFGNFFDDRDREMFWFKGYYAQEHDDGHLWWKRQVMFILDNPAGHRLWCKQRVTTPVSGDVVLLYPSRKHALYPAAGVSASTAARSPLKLLSVVF